MSAPELETYLGAALVALSIVWATVGLALSVWSKP